MSKKNTSISVFTDGGCHGNPGPGGWSYLIEVDGVESFASGGVVETTNNRMELSAVIAALNYLKRGVELGNRQIRLYTDSQYVRNGITTWIGSWLKNGWLTAGKKPVKNRDLWMELHALNRQLEVEWCWIRGHSGVQGNEKCDALVQKEIRLLRGGSS